LAVGSRYSVRMQRRLFHFSNIAYCILGSPKEGYLSRVGKVKPTLLTFPPISLPPSGLQVDPRYHLVIEIMTPQGES
jgi:hypothetical protein